MLPPPTRYAVVQVGNGPEFAHRPMQNLFYPKRLTFYDITPFLVSPPSPAQSFVA